MIRNRLSELLSERGLKISRVSKEVSIARSSLTSMVQNDSEMIRYDAIDKLCSFLNINPGDFFEYNPLELDYSFDEDPIVDYEINYEFETKLVLKKFVFDFLVDTNIENKKNTFDLEVSFNGFRNESYFIFKITNEEKLIDLQGLIKQLSPGLRNILYKRLQKNIHNYVVTSLLNDIANDSILTIPKNDLIRLKKALEKTQIKLESDIFTEY
ncbi:helix-turn-helix transcriptional regulator [Staphylococcus equorum]|uniref:helix-turn-helix domain-containing protein n=1 Tax=Staphylococcus equorum TaxID=246432 RepID=UPI0018D70D0F|nr:helix-turn-helix transcriptional regulator [Staphylococcus equorum]QPS99846.1 helix-turn-helix transcriptional regulator [Staphylococcus equorum]